MHETIPEFGLINMNSRVYDPQLGVFLSPDPLMQDMENSQNFNRYAYCFNNPLKYTDPSGEIAWFIPVIVGAVVGAFSGASIQSGTAAFWSWKSNAWQGAIAGALIGGASGGAAFGVSALGGGAMLAGTTAGTIGGAGFNGIATNWDGIAILLSLIHI